MSVTNKELVEIRVLVDRTTRDFLVVLTGGDPQKFSRGVGELLSKAVIVSKPIH
jgi:organic radical activating enzyme